MAVVVVLVMVVVVVVLLPVSPSYSVSFRVVVSLIRCPAHHVNGENGSKTENY